MLACTDTQDDSSITFLPTNDQDRTTFGLKIMASDKPAHEGCKMKTAQKRTYLSPVSVLCPLELYTNVSAQYIIHYCTVGDMICLQ